MKPLRVAVVGAGPSGLYAAGHLLEGPGGTYLDGRLTALHTRAVEVDVFDRLPTQWGLVRHGVAPDHPDKKQVATVFEQIAARPGFRFFGNIEVGRDVLTRELAQWYDAVVYAVGATGDATLGIPGEDLPGCLAARAFVAWYNGHPDYSTAPIDLSGERAVVIGNGNVAMDVARLLTTPIDTLARTDIADHALDALRASRVREVVVLGRRGRQHGAFNNPELEELGHLPGVDLAVVHGEPEDSAALDPSTARKLRTLHDYATRPSTGAERRIVLRFQTSPLEVLGTESVRGLRVRGPDGDEVLDAGLVLRAIGYFGTPTPGLPFDHDRGVIPHTDGRITGVPGSYVTGWIKRGPRGIIGTNKKCARDTVRSLLADADAGALRPGTHTGEQVERALRERRPALVDQVGWLALDHHERAAGLAAGRPRVKVTDLAGQLAHGVR
ncbi:MULTISPECIES: FAD-dependent oxidoreductase [unclassified Nocardia]|uniref:FAD-dependent oxidoreductase n=1 Tax=unclassified Nocardia TaxID=2637762 RepID=UPI0033B75D90